VKYAAYPRYEPSGIEWLGEVPKHWSVDRLKWSIRACQNGVWGEEPDGNDDIACVRVADFDRTRLRIDGDNLTLRKVEHSQRRGRTLQVGDLLIEKSGGGENQLVGRVVLYDHPIEAVCSNFIARMPLADDMVPSFWAYVHAALYSSHLNLPSIKQTTGIQNLDTSSYLNECFVYPPMSEQRAIADFLDRETATLDTLIAKKRELIEKLKEKRTALISHTVTRGLPPDAARAAGLNPHPRLKASGIEWLGEVPEHWSCAQLRRFMGFITSGSRGWAEHYSDEGSIFIRIGNLTRDSIGVDLSDTQYVDPPEGAEGERTRIQQGDLLFSITAYLGSVAVAPKELIGAYINQHIALVRIKSRALTAEYAAYVTLADVGQNQLNGQGYGGTKIQLALDDVKALWLPLPPVSEQHAIVNYLNTETAKIDLMIHTIDAAVQKLQEYRTALITAAVTGKIDVRGILTCPS
jgi:type I restriction enzyme S subunit